MTELKCIVCGKTLTGRQTHYCSKACYKQFLSEQRRGNKVCAVCGKPLPPHKRKVCSDECLKIWNTRYNSEYVSKRRKNDEEFAKKSAYLGARSSQRTYAKKKWNERLEHAGAILKLAEKDDAQVLIAKYLDENFLGRGERQHREFTSEEEAKAGEALASLGDIISS